MKFETNFGSRVGDKFLKRKLNISKRIVSRIYLDSHKYTWPINHDGNTCVNKDNKFLFFADYFNFVILISAYLNLGREGGCRKLNLINFFFLQVL